MDPQTTADAIITDKAQAPPSYWLSLSRLEITAILICVALAHWFYSITLELPLLFDAHSYLEGAKEILAQGLFSKTSVSDWRTYGYPLLLTGIIRWSDWLGISPRLLTFEVQLAAYVAALFICRYTMLRCRVPVAVSRTFFVCFALNPFALILVAHVLTEAPSLSTSILVFACMLYVRSVVPGSRQYLCGVMLGSVLAGWIVMIRPSNVFIVFAWAFSLLATLISGLRRYQLRRVSFIKIMAITAISGFVPCLPQFINNVMLYGKYTPLLATSLGTMQVRGGVQWIKYATAYVPGTNGSIIYTNPFLHQTKLDSDRPMRWYLEHPAKGALTAALHVYNVLDQDLPFVYNTDLIPPYFPAASVASQMLVGFPIAGALLVWRRRKTLEEPTRRAFELAVLIIICHLGLHSVFSVEARYGVNALLFMFPLAALSAWFIVRRSTSWRRWAALTSVFAYLTVAWLLTAWVRDQAPAIRAEARRREVYRSLAGKPSLVPSELQKWSAYQATLRADNVALLVSPDGSLVSLIQHQIPVTPNTNYVIEFEALSHGPLTAPLSVDFYGDGYDSAEQNLVTSAIDGSFRQIRAHWNSGPVVPEVVFLRFVTLSKNTLEIRRVTLRSY